MHMFSINILIFSFDNFFNFRTRMFICRKTVVYAVTVWYVFLEHSSTHWTAYTDECKTHHTINAYTIPVPKDKLSGSNHVEV